ncbi:NLR family CARD domain-containing protein 3-like [Hoplias malabaricus]|uniref:NLR family CARD domain-containing protein 3-like n=1 Tax=Hoplias malabaricus TaxID=27720 RepID=UPI0034633A2E
MANIPELLLNTLEDLSESDLEKFKWHLMNSVEIFTPISKSELEPANRHNTVDKMVQKYRPNGAVKVTLIILEKMDQNQLAVELRSKVPGGSKRRPLQDPLLQEASQDQLHIYLMSTLREKYERILIGSSQKGHKEFLEDIYTDLVVVPNESGGVIHEHEVIQMEMSSNRATAEEVSLKCSDLFKVQSGTSRRNRKVMTMGIAGVGKTLSVNKFIFDWTKKEENQDIKMIFPLPFRELNLKNDKKFSLIELLNDFFFIPKHELKSLPDDDGQILFIFDGMDECRFPLPFKSVEEVKEVNVKTSLGTLFTNLMNRNLLPFTLIWVTCRPAAAHLIPREHIDLVTEVRGFNDEQKETYFRKLCKGDASMKILSHIKKSRSLHIMCQIPVFCWISATVLQPLLNKGRNEETPTTLTGMYVSFLLQQKILMKKKYSEETKSVDSEHVMLKLGKLAFRNLESGTLIFYEEELRKCGIDVRDGSVFSGVCTQIFSQQEGISERNIFSFVHLSVQESLAALYVHYQHCTKNRNALEKGRFLNPLKWRNKRMKDLHECAVNKALQSVNGHLDLFLRFLLGLALKENQRLLSELLPSLKIKEESYIYTATHIKRILNEKISSDRIMNLFHCLNELKDNSLTTEIQKSLNSGGLSKQELSSTQWSALLFVLQMSEETQEKFELKKYTPSDEGLRRLLPVVKNTRRALLDCCNLSEKTCGALASVLRAETALIELDLSNNDLTYSGMEKLSAGMKSPHCKLQILRLSGCMITEGGCSTLASALSSNPSHLRELDLTYNHPGESGIKVLSERLKDLHCALSTLRFENGGKTRLKPGIKKYACELTLDPNTAHTNLILSEENRKVECVRGKPQLHPDHPERFDVWLQVLCRESLTERCYWETEWSGEEVNISVAYKSISRKGQSCDSEFGWNKKSWSLSCSNNKYFVLHNKNRTDLPPPSRSKRVGVYVDCEVGTLSFYSISPDTHTHLHTLHTTFTEPLYAGYKLYSLVSGSSLRICSL